MAIVIVALHTTVIVMAVGIMVIATNMDVNEVAMVGQQVGRAEINLEEDFYGSV